MPSPKKAKKTTPDYVLHYWGIQGRAEVIRLTLAVCGLEWSESHVTDETEAETKKKAGSEESPFGQWPMLVEDGVVLAQTHAIIKHLGRQNGLYGSKNKLEDYLCDTFLIGVDALTSQLSNMKWDQGNTPEAQANFEKKHLSPDSKTGKCSGAHMAYLEGFLERSPTEWVAGGKNMSVADIALFQIFGELKTFFGDKVTQNYPKCAANYKLVSEIEEISKYMNSEKRFKE